MSSHEIEQEKADRAPVREPAEASKGEPDLVELASAVGNQAFTQALAQRAPLPVPILGRAALAAPLRRVSSASQTLVSRENGDDEAEDPGLTEGQKARMRSMCVAPIRSAAGRLAAGENADVRSVVRHLRPVVTALNGFAAKGQTQATIAEAAAELGVHITILDSLRLNDRQVVFLTRTAWQTARRHLATSKRQLRAPADAPPDDVSAIEEGRAHLDALSQQIAASIQDLVEAPRTQEGFKTVLETAADLIDAFDSFTAEGGETPPSFLAARRAFFDGIARLAPLALGKEEALKRVQQDLSRIANQLAALSDDEVEEEPEPEEGEEETGDDDEPEEPAEPDPAFDEPAPHPNPLPPPPPPPVPVP